MAITYTKDGKTQTGTSVPVGGTVTDWGNLSQNKKWFGVSVKDLNKPLLPSTTQDTSSNTPITPPTNQVVPIKTVETTQQKPSITSTSPMTGVGETMAGIGATNQNILEQYKADEQRAIDEAKASTDVLTQEKNRLAGEVSNLGEYQTGLEKQAGIPEKQKQLKAINTQIANLTASFNQGMLDIEGKPIPMQFITGQQAQVQKQYAIQASALTAQAQQLSGDIQGAEDSITKMVDLQYKGITAQYENAKDNLDRNYDLMTTSQKNLADAKMKEYDAALKQAESEKADMKTLISNASIAGASASLIEKALKTNDSLEASKILGVYGGGLDAMEKKAQIRKINAEIAAAADTGADTSTISDPGVAGGMGGSILAQTGISLPVFNYLTQGTPSMSRMTASQRNKIMSEATNFLNAKGLDVSTFQSQFKTQNEILSANTSRQAKTQIMEQELIGTIDNLSSVVNDKELGKVNLVNVAKVWAGQQTNDKLAMQYAFHFQQLKNELAGYFAASQGKNSPDVIDNQDAAQAVTAGMSTGSLQGFRNAVEGSTVKMKGVLDSSVDNARKSIWGLFGVADKYSPTANQIGATGSGNSYTVENNSSKIINNQGKTSSGISFTIIP